MKNKARWKLLGNTVLVLAIALGTIGVVRLVAYAYQLCGCGCESFVCDGGSMYTPVGEGTPTPTPKCKQVDCRCLPNYTNTPGSSPTPTDTPIGGGGEPPTPTPLMRECGVCPMYCDAIETPQCGQVAVNCSENGCGASLCEDACGWFCSEGSPPCESETNNCKDTYCGASDCACSPSWCALSSGPGTDNVSCSAKNDWDPPEATPHAWAGWKCEGELAGDWSSCDTGACQPQGECETGMCNGQACNCYACKPGTLHTCDCCYIGPCDCCWDCNEHGLLKQCWGPICLEECCSSCEPCN